MPVFVRLAFTRSLSSSSERKNAAAHGSISTVAAGGLPIAGCGPVHISAPAENSPPDKIQVPTG